MVLAIRKESTPPYLREIGDIREDCSNMAWAEIKKKHMDFHLEDDDDSSIFRDCTERDPKQEDTYEEVEQYDWTALNFDFNA